MIADPNQSYTGGANIPAGSCFGDDPNPDSAEIFIEVGCN